VTVFPLLNYVIKLCILVAFLSIDSYLLILDSLVLVDLVIYLATKPFLGEGRRLVTGTGDETTLATATGTTWLVFQNNT